MKIGKSASQPLDDAADFQVIKALAASQDWVRSTRVGETRDLVGAAREKYVDRVLGFVDVATLSPLKIVINSGNGAAGPSFDALADALRASGASAEFIRVHHAPDATFPNGIPNPLLPDAPGQNSSPHHCKRPRKQPQFRDALPKPSPAHPREKP